MWELLRRTLRVAAGESGDGAGDGARDHAKELFFSAVDTDFRAWLTQVDGHESTRDVGCRWERSLASARR